MEILVGKKPIKINECNNQFDNKHYKNENINNIKRLNCF